MIPLRSVGRIARPRVISQVVHRFQSTAGNVDPLRILNDLQDPSNPANSSKEANSPKESNTPSTTQTSSKESPQKSNNKNTKSKLAPKLREIRNQVEQTIRKSNDLNECVEIFEEGVSYLRQVQQQEKIDDFSIYTSFQRLGIQLLEKYIGNSPETQSSLNHSVNDIIEIFMRNSVIHNYHFYQAMKYELTQKHYEQVLAYWVKYLESSGTVGLSDKIDIPFAFIRQWDTVYNKNVIRDFTFYCYMMGAINENYKFSMSDLSSLLALKEIPVVRRIVNNFQALGLNKVLGKDLSAFQKFTLNISRENLDVNGVQFLKKIDDAVVLRDMNMLNSLYDEINTKAVNNQTLYKIMTGYYELEQFNTIFKIFEELVSKGDAIDKSIWDLIVRSMGHSSLVVPMSEKSKQELSLNIEKLINTMVESGVSVDARILSSIVASFANLDDFDKVQKYLDQYNSIPTTHALKNNYLVGLILNKKITEAEEQLQQYMKEDKSFNPSTTTVNNMLNHYAKAENLPAVNGIINFMNEKHIPENIVTLTIVIDLYFTVNLKNHKIPEIKEILSLFKGSAVKMNFHTYSVIIDGLVRAHNITAARAIYNYLKANELKKSSSPQILTSMIKGELELGSIDEAETLFDQYIATIRNDPRIWNMMISTLLSKGNDPLALHYYDKFKQQAVNSVYPNFFTYYFLLNHFKRKDNKAVIELLLKDLGELDLSNMGRELPKILHQLSRSYTLPQNLTKYA